MKEKRFSEVHSRPRVKIRKPGKKTHIVWEVKGAFKKRRRPKSEGSTGVRETGRF